MARDAPARPLEQLGQLLDHLVAVGLAQAPPAGDHHRASSSFGPSLSSTWDASTVAAPVGAEVGHLPGVDRGRAAAPGSAANDLARTTKIPGAAPVKRALSTSVPPKMACSVTSPPSLASRPTMLVSTGRSILTDRRPAMSRPS